MGVSVLQRGRWLLWLLAKGVAGRWRSGCGCPAAGAKDRGARGRSAWPGRWAAAVVVPPERRKGRAAGLLVDVGRLDQRGEGGAGSAARPWRWRRIAPVVPCVDLVKVKAAADDRFRD